MKSDLTRSTFAAAKHYRSVRMQQGRVQLDADWNEQQDITAHRTEAEAADLLGPLAVPIAGRGFALSPAGAGSTTLAIGRGHAYVDGVLCENDSDNLSLDTQPDLPATACVLVGGKAQGLPAPNGLYLGFIHAWPRHLTALEDPDMREVALDGPDTATRVKALWQVQLLQVAADPKAVLGCGAALSVWDALVQPSTALLGARAEPTPDPADPCKLSPTAGYRRLDNLLYRVEVHLMPGADPAFKWSHDNGSIVSAWLSANPGALANQLDLGLATLGRDAVLSIAPGQWLELFDDTNELLGQAGTLVKVLKTAGTTVTVDITAANVVPAGAPTAWAQFKANPRVRRWDGWNYVKQATGATPGAGWLELEDGVQVKFANKAARFRHGDYWLIAARTATHLAGAGVEWPLEGPGKVPVFLPPQGVPHGWGRLGLVSCTDGAWASVADCRPLFPALTELTTLSYVGGDAQVVIEGEPLALPKPLEVGVAMGAWPVAVATVRFTVGSGTLDNGAAILDVVLTPADRGVARAHWTLAPGQDHQYASAQLLVQGAPSADHWLPVHFSANLLARGDCCCSICVSPQAQAKDSTALQQAIERLVKQGGGVLCLDLGDYALDRPLLLDGGQHIGLRGKGSLTRLVATEQVLAINRCQDIRLEQLWLESTASEAAGPVAALTVSDTDGLVLSGVHVQMPAGLAGGVALNLRGTLEDLRLSACSLSAAIGLTTSDLLSTVAAPIALASLQMDDCRLVCVAIGAWVFVSGASTIRISRSRFTGCSTGGLMLGGDGKAGAVGSVSQVDVEGNHFEVDGPAISFAQLPVMRITGNVMTSADALGAPGGIAGYGGEITVSDNHVAGYATGMQLALAVKLQVRGNRVSGAGIGIQVFYVADALIAGNQLSDLDQRPTSLSKTEAVALTVGITVDVATSALIHDNSLQRIGLQGLQGESIATGISASNCVRAVIARNALTDFIGHGGFSARVAGISVYNVLLADIDGNGIIRQPGDAGGSNSNWNGIVVGTATAALVPGRKTSGPGVFAGPTLAETTPSAAPLHATLLQTVHPLARALAGTVRDVAVLETLPAAAVVLASVKAAAASAAAAAATRDAATPAASASASAVPASTTVPSVIVRGNQVYGQGSGQCAGINLGSDAGGCDFSHNQCTRVVAPTTETLRPVVEITAGRIAASHNAVYGTSPSAATPIAAMSLWPTGNRYTVLGNLTSASTGAVSILVQGNALSGPWAPLNTLI